MATLPELKKELEQSLEERKILRAAKHRHNRLSKWLRENNLDVDAADEAHKAADYDKRIEEKNKHIAEVRKKIKNFEPDVPPFNGGWYPPAIDNHYPSSGSLGSPHKIVLHTTEGFGLPQYSGGSNPHFTIDPKVGGKVWQHVSITQGSSALQNLPGGVETNHAGAIQIEMIGFASSTPGWSDTEYANVKKLTDWIAKWANVKKTDGGLTWTGSHHSMPNADWLSFNGYCGHQHVPENDHWDPGQFKVDKLF